MSDSKQLDQMDDLDRQVEMRRLMELRGRGYLSPEERVRLQQLEKLGQLKKDAFTKAFRNGQMTNPNEPTPNVGGFSGDTSGYRRAMEHIDKNYPDLGKPIEPVKTKEDYQQDTDDFNALKKEFDESYQEQQQAKLPLMRKRLSNK